MQAIRFKLDGVIYSVTRDQVAAGVAGEEPQPIQKLAVRVGAQWYPVKQAFGRAVGLGNDKFNSRRAFDLLQRLDFEVHDTDVDGPLPVDVIPGAGSARSPTSIASSSSGLPFSSTRGVRTSMPQRSSQRPRSSASGSEARRHDRDA